MFDSVLQIAILTIFPIAMVLAALSDLFTMTVSNRLTGALAAAFFIVAPLSGMGLEAIGLHVAVCLGMLVLGIAAFAMGWVGGGDAKLIAATGLWLGLAPLPHYLIVATICGGVMALVLLKFRTVPLPVWADRQQWIARLHRADCGAPYCIALGIAGLSAYPSSQLFSLAAS